jgi:putative transposase
MNSSWLSKEQVCLLTGWSPRYVEIKVASGELVTRDGAERMRNGRLAKEYAAASLPEAARAKLTSLSEPVAASNTAAHGPLFARVTSAPQTRQNQRIVLSPQAERQAEERLQIIQPLLDFCSDPGNRARFAQLRLSDGRAVTNADLLVQYLIETHSNSGYKLSQRSLWRWKKAYSEKGLVGLARGLRADKGQSRFFARYQAAAQLVASIYLKPYQSVSIAYSNLLRDHELLGIPQHELPSYETVRSYLESLPQPVKVLAREGERAHNERMSLYLQRSYEDIAANQIWVSDHMIHDVEVRNDCFFGVEPNAPMRLRFTCLMDMRSRKIVGYSWTPEGSSRSITSALRFAVRMYGPCEVFYCDNGKDYQKTANGAKIRASESWYREDLASLQKSGVLARLGMQVQFCMKYHPQSKPIERFFGTMHKQFDARFPHYTTGNAYLKPDQTVVAMATHRKLLKMGRGDESPLVPASHFIKMAIAWIEEFNATHQHTGKGMSGRTPNEVFEAGYPASQRRTVDPAILDQLFFEREKRRVRECAVVLAGRRYMASSPASSAAMYLANEQDVLICFDPHDLDRAIITDLDGCKLADVEAERLTSNSAGANTAIAASMQERRRLRNATASSIRRIHSNVAMLGHKSDLERLHEQAQLPAAVGEFTTQRAARQQEEEQQTKHLHADDIGDRLAARLAARNSGGTANGTNG